MKELILPQGAFLDLKPLYDTKRPDSGRYRLDQKCEAVVMMKAYMSINEMSLDLEPDYHAVNEMLGYNVQTLKNWWENRDGILTMGKAFVAELKDAHLMKLFTISHRIQEAMLNRELEDVPFKDLTAALKTLTIVTRVVQDGTISAPKTVNHNHRVQMVPPGSEG